MNPADCYHTGLVVDDMAGAAERLTAAMGYRWTKPVESTLSVTTADGDVEVPFRFVYSVNAPHLELIQEVPGTIWTAPRGGGAHHLGYWVDDITAAAAQLEDSGYRLEARPSGDTLSMFAYYIDTNGVRIEIVDRALFPDWPGFLQAMAA
ncbi:VOC family protein [Mycobacterium sp.]|uniref:VOC family protein n=1 Tax=Mycobacterium sp. TaxID=1785 RepID=UPI00260E36AE|nr:VOC family protein [Mycobacterium sp.]